MHKQMIFRVLARGGLMVSLLAGLLALAAFAPGIQPSAALLLPTKTRTPTPTMKPPVGFSKSSLNKIAPGDLLTQISAWGGAGAGGYGQCRHEPNLTLHRIQRKSNELMDMIWIPVCGVHPGDALKLVIAYPGGRSRTINGNAQASGMDGQGELMIEYVPQIDDPPGNYRFTVSGPTGSASQVMTFVRPVQPRVYWMGDGRVLAINFKPNEKLVAAFYEDWNFSGWKEIQADRMGRAQLKTSLPEYQTVVIAGPQTGKSFGVFTIPGAPYKGNEIPHILGQGGSQPPAGACEAGMPINYSIGQELNVRSGPLSIYASPSKGSAVVRKVQSQSRFVIVDGPTCQEGQVWWRIITPKGYDGWVTEADMQR